MPLKSFTDHPELLRLGGRKIQHRNWTGDASRPADIPLRITTKTHRHRPPFCCNRIFTRPITEEDHTFDIHSVMRHIASEND